MRPFCGTDGAAGSTVLALIKDHTRSVWRLARRLYTAEARTVARHLREQPARRPQLADLAGIVHLSPAQMSRVFASAYGQTPIAHQATPRVQTLTRLLHETDTALAEAMRQVGWNSRGHASSMFRRIVGLTPSQHRTPHLHPIRRRRQSAREPSLLHPTRHPRRRTTTPRAR